MQGGSSFKRRKIHVAGPSVTQAVPSQVPSQWQGANFNAQGPTHQQYTPTQALTDGQSTTPHAKEPPPQWTKVPIRSQSQWQGATHNIPVPPQHLNALALGPLQWQSPSAYTQPPPQWQDPSTWQMPQLQGTTSQVPSQWQAGRLVPSVTQVAPQQSDALNRGPSQWQGATPNIPVPPQQPYLPTRGPAQWLGATPNVQVAPQQSDPLTQGPSQWQGATPNLPVPPQQPNLLTQGPTQWQSSLAPTQRPPQLQSPSSWHMTPQCQGTKSQVPSQWQDFGLGPSVTQPVPIQVPSQLQGAATPLTLGPTYRPYTPTQVLTEGQRTTLHSKEPQQWMNEPIEGPSQWQGDTPHVQVPPQQSDPQKREQSQWQDATTNVPVPPLQPNELTQGPSQWQSHLARTQRPPQLQGSSWQMTPQCQGTMSQVQYQWQAVGLDAPSNQPQEVHGGRRVLSGSRSRATINQSTVQHPPESNQPSQVDKSVATQQQDFTNGGHDQVLGQHVAGNIDDNSSVLVTENDIQDILDIFIFAHLDDVYVHLGLTYKDIENANQEASTPKEKARKLLYLWRSRRSVKATRNEMVTAMKKCPECRSYLDKLKKKWGYPSPDTPKFDFKEECKKELTNLYNLRMKQVHLLPWFTERIKTMDDIYVSLKLEKKDKGSRTTIPLENNEDLVTIEAAENMYATRIIVKGLAGSGKSTLLAWLAYTWAQQNPGCTLYRFELVFMLTLRDLERECSLVDAIFRQILAEDSVSKVDHLENYIQSNPDKVLVLLDGYDENSSIDLKSPKGNIEKILSYDCLRKVYVIVTSRPHKELGEYPSLHYESVQLTGFSKNNIDKYIKRFFQHNTDNKKGLVKGLKCKLRYSPILTSLSHIPVMLMIMCLLWEDEQAIPTTQSEIYEKFVFYLWRKYCDRYSLSEDKNDFLSKISKMAFDGLVNNEDNNEDKHIFSTEDFGINLDKGCRVGILTMERVLKQWEVSSSVTFLHKSFQEYCAGYYLANLLDKDLNKFKDDLNKFDSTAFVLNKFDSTAFVLSKFEILKFCCGLCKTDASIALIQHMIKLFDSKTDIQLTITDKDETISPILMLMYESKLQFNENHLPNKALAESLKSLFSSSEQSLSIRSRTKPLPIFHHFVKSSFGDSTLRHVKSIEFNTRRDSHDMITDTLKCMPYVECIEINLAGQIMESVKSVDRLGCCIEKLKNLSSLSLLYMDNITNIIQSMSNRVMEKIYLGNVKCNGDELSVVISHQTQLQRLRLFNVTLTSGCVAAILESVKSPLVELTLDKMHVGEAVDNIGHIIPRLELLSLTYAGLGEKEIETLCKFLCKARNLTILVLHANTMSGVNLAYSLKACDKLTRLNLDDTGLTDEAATVLAQHFCHLTNLKDLKLRNNNIGNSGIDSLFRHLHLLPNLSTFHINPTLDSQCSDLVKGRLAALGKEIPYKAGRVEIRVKGGIKAIRKESKKHMPNITDMNDVVESLSSESKSESMTTS